MLKLLGLLIVPSRRLSRGGFTLVELLVVIGIIAILAGVALGPITSGIKKAQENAGVQTSRTINLCEFQYSTDNGAYPFGAKSENIAILLLNGRYTTDPTIFALVSAHKYSGTGSATSYSDFGSGNIDWDFMTGPSSTAGLTSSCSDLTPTVWNTLGTAFTMPSTAGAGYSVTITSAQQYGTDGLAVGFHGNNASFIKSVGSGGTYTVPIVSKADGDTAANISVVP